MLELFVGVSSSAVNLKCACLRRKEGEIARLSWLQYYTIFEVVGYRNSMRLDRVIVPEVNGHTLSQSDVDSWPRGAMQTAAVIASNVH